MKHLCIAIPKKKGEPARKFLMELDILDKSLKIFSGGNDLYLPLERELTSEEFGELPEEAR